MMELELGHNSLFSFWLYLIFSLALDKRLAASSSSFSQPKVWDESMAGAGCHGSRHRRDRSGDCGLGVGASVGCDITTCTLSYIEFFPWGATLFG